MKKFVQNKFLFLIPIIFLLSACGESSKIGVENQNPPQNPPRISCTATTSIQYNNPTCSATGGCELTFSCPLTASRDSTSFQKITNQITQIFKAPTPVTMEITTLTINQPALLQASAGAAPTNWYNTPVSCTQDGANLICDAFLPIASDFTITGTLGEQDLTLNVTVTNGLTPGSTTECGQIGTTVQRMFDCSQRVANYAGFGNGDATFTAFTGATPDCPTGTTTTNTACNPNKNWFLVSCPDTDNQKCFWLSPVMNSAVNAALAPDEFDSNGVAISTYNGGRFLWSGKSFAGPHSDGTYNFFEANGNNPHNAGTAYYDFYAFVTNGTMASLNVGGGPFIYRPDVSGTPTPIMNVFNMTAYNLATFPKSVCTNPLSTDPILLTGTTYQWQMPSYPMLMTLTGGYSTDVANADCEPGGSDYESLPGGGKAWCNIGTPKSVQGFRAIDPVPGFDSTNTVNSIFWSSSIAVPIGGWLFDGGFDGFPGSIEHDLPLGSGYFVRCVSAAW